MKRIIQSINRIAKISDEAMNEFIACLQPLEVVRRGILIEPGKKNPNIYFIEQGITRSFTIVDGKEVTSWFSKEGDVTFSTNSFYGATEGYETETVQALENTLVYYLPIAELDALCYKYIDLANWLRLLHQHAFLAVEKRLISRLYFSAEERYNKLLVTDADLFQRVNLGYIASYLGISHVTLCALRK